MAKVEVLSTLELLRLATCVKNKAVHFVSTLAVSTLNPLQTSSTCPDETGLSLLNKNGYLTTKWVSEQLLYTASQRGIETHVYRPGNVIAGKQGVYEPESNHTLLRLKGMLQLGKVHVGQHEMLEMMPVDLLVASIVKLALKPITFAYNLNNVEQISWVQYLLIARKQGYVFEWLNDEKE